jgi:hypothetical protein
VFLVGLAALAVLVGRPGVRRSRSLRLALASQGLHVLEHVALTVTAVIGGRALGVTTVFGLLEPGPLMWTYRPMAHFALNAAATFFALDAVVGLIRGSGTWAFGRRPSLLRDRPPAARSSAGRTPVGVGCPAADPRSGVSVLGSPAVTGRTPRSGRRVRAERSAPR